MSTILPSQADRPDLLGHVGANLRRLRRGLTLSQTGLAERSGVSRRMIVAIEGGEANVSLSTIDRLAAALEVSFAELIRAPDALDSRRIATLAWRGGSVDSQAIMLGAAPSTRETELWIWSLGEGERYPSEANSDQWHEMLFVLEGRLVVERPDGRDEVNEGDFLIFTSPGPYVFANGGGGPVRFLRNVVL